MRVMVSHEISIHTGQSDHASEEKPAVGRLAMVTTIPLPIKLFYKQQLAALIEAGVETTVICAPHDGPADFAPDGSRHIPVRLTRAITPLTDLKALWRLYRTFARGNFDIVQYMTPKAALLASLAAFLARAPHRLYLMAGLFYQGQRGLRRAMFKLFEMIACRLSTKVMPWAHELVDVLDGDGIAPRVKCEVLRYGTACGIDLTLFDADQCSRQRDAVRAQHGIPPDGILIGAFSRLVGDKGVNELVAAFEQVARQHDNVYLLVVGRLEDYDPLKPETVAALRNHDRIQWLEWQPREALPPLYASLDVFCLPSYREGFGLTLLEAQAMGVAVIGTKIVGCREAVADGETGLLVEPRNTAALVAGLHRLISEPRLRQAMGCAGRKRVEEKFDARDMVQAVVGHRLRLLSDGGRG